MSGRKSSYFESTFADALAVYMLSLTIDFDYADLRERGVSTAGCSCAGGAVTACGGNVSAECRV